MNKVGDRIGAILSANKSTVYLLGYGTYEGREMISDFPIPNPKLLLDDGTVVWGYQCWWGPEEIVKQSIGDRKVVPAKIEPTKDDEPK